MGLGENQGLDVPKHTVVDVVNNEGRIVGFYVERICAATPFL